MDLDRSTIEINPCMPLNDMHMVLQNAKKILILGLKMHFRILMVGRAHFLKIQKRIHVFYIR